MQLLSQLQAPYEIPLLKFVVADLVTLPPTQQSAWIELLRHSFSASGLTLSKGYLRRLSTLAQEVGTGELQRLSDRWFALLPQLPKLSWEEYRSRVDDFPSSIGHQTLLPAGINMVRALAIAKSLVPESGQVPGLERLAVWAATTVPSAGPRCTPLASAAFRALSNVPRDDGVAALGRLRGSITRASFQRVISKEITRAATARGVDPEVLAETAATDYGLRDGIAERMISGYTATLRILEPGKSSVTWRTPAGKDQRSVPAVVKTDHADELSDLKATSKQLNGETAAQARRLEGLWATERSWQAAAFAKTYLAHGLLGWLARRLVWEIKGEDRAESRSAVFESEAWRDARGDAVAVHPGATVRAWHPATANPAERADWAQWLSRTGTVQPFPQIHRSLHYPTAAEQHQSFTDALSGMRARQSALRRKATSSGWQMSFFGGFDGGSEGEVTRALSALGLSVGLGLTLHGPLDHNAIADELQAGSLRFYRRNQEAMALAQLPPRVYSEVLREAMALLQ